MRFILAAAFSCVAFWSVCAEEQAVAPGARDLADIMSATQLRHLKLSFAGAVQNWDLAKYEVGQMQRSFASAAQYYPVFGEVPVAKLIGDISEPALAEVDKAITAHDRDAFLKSFEKLTGACNACHQAAKVGFIKIQVPTASPFSNQVFSPVK